MCNFLQLVTYVQYLLWCFGLNFTFSLCIHRGLANFDPQEGHITRKHKNASRPLFPNTVPERSNSRLLLYDSMGTSTRIKHLQILAPGALFNALQEPYISE